MMNEENVLGRNGGIGFQLERPVTVVALEAQQRVRSGADGVLK